MQRNVLEMQQFDKDVKQCEYVVLVQHEEQNFYLIQQQKKYLCEKFIPRIEARGNFIFCAVLDFHMDDFGVFNPCALLVKKLWWKNLFS